MTREINDSSGVAKCLNYALYPNYERLLQDLIANKSRECKPTIQKDNQIYLSSYKADFKVPNVICPLKTPPPKQSANSPSIECECLKFIKNLLLKAQKPYYTVVDMETRKSLLKNCATNKKKFEDKKTKIKLELSKNRQSNSPKQFDPVNLKEKSSGKIARAFEDHFAESVVQLQSAPKFYSSGRNIKANKLKCKPDLNKLAKKTSASSVNQKLPAKISNHLQESKVEKSNFIHSNASIDSEYSASNFSYDKSNIYYSVNKPKKANDVKSKAKEFQTHKHRSRKPNMINSFSSDSEEQLVYKCRHINILCDKCARKSINSLSRS
jgi:hypothetical protein